MIKNIFITLLILGTIVSQSVEAKGFKFRKNDICKPVYTVPSGVNEGSQIVKCGKTYGIKNSFSFPVVAPKFEKIENIDDNLILVKLGKNQYGVMTYLGKTLVAPKYRNIAISKIQLGAEDSDDIYFGKLNRTWYFLNDNKEIPLEKNKKGEKFEPVFRTSLHKVPHKVNVDGNKYRLWMGELDMGDLIMDTPLKVHISPKLPKKTDLKVVDMTLISIFQKK